MIYPFIITRLHAKIYRDFDPAQKKTHPEKGAFWISVDIFFVKRFDKGGDKLLFAGDDARQTNGAVLRQNTEGVFYQCVCRFSVAHQGSGFLYEIGQHTEHHREAVLAAGLLQIRTKLLLKIPHLLKVQKMLKVPTLKVLKQVQKPAPKQAQKTAKKTQMFL